MGRGNDDVGDRNAAHKSVVEGTLGSGPDRDGGRHCARNLPPGSCREDAAVRRRFHQGDPHADRADHLLHRRARHRAYGRHGPGRPRRAQGHRLFRDHHHDCAGDRLDHGQSAETWRRDEHRSHHHQRQRDRALCQADRGRRIRAVPDEHHSRHLHRRVCRGQYPAGAVHFRGVRLCPDPAGRAGAGAGRHHRRRGEDDLCRGCHRDVGSAPRGVRRNRLYGRKIRRRLAGVVRQADRRVLPHLRNFRDRGVGAGCLVLRRQPDQADPLHLGRIADLYRDHVVRNGAATDDLKARAARMRTERGGAGDSRPATRSTSTAPVSIWR